MAERNSVCLFIPQSHKFRLILATSKNDFLPWLTLTCDSIKLQMFVRAAVGIVCIFLTPLHSGSIFPCLWRSVMQVVTGNAPSFCYEGFFCSLRDLGNIAIYYNSNPFLFRASSAARSSRRFSIGPAPRISSAPYCASTGTAASTAASRSASRQA